MDVRQKPGRNRDMIYTRSVLNIFLRKNNYNKSIDISNIN